MPLCQAALKQLKDRFPCQELSPIGRNDAVCSLMSITNLSGLHRSAGFKQTLD